MFSPFKQLCKQAFRKPPTPNTKPKVGTLKGPSEAFLIWTKGNLHPNLVKKHSY